MATYTPYLNKKTGKSRLTRKQSRNTTFIKNKKMTTKFRRRAARLQETSNERSRGGLR
jgi:hypothetical protein